MAEKGNRERTGNQGPKATNGRRPPPAAPVAQQLASGLRLHQAGDLQAAQRAYHEVLSKDPCNADAHHLLGMAACQRGQNDQAVASIRRAIALKPGVAAYYGSLTLAFLSQGQLDAAAGSVRQAKQCGLTEVAQFGNLGVRFLQEGKLDQAAASFQAVLHVSPECFKTHNNLGKLYCDQDKLQDAVACYQRAVRIQPEFAMGHYNLGNALRRLERLDEAAASYERALQRKPQMAKAHNNLGLVRMQQGDVEAAWDAFRRALEIDPLFVEAHVNLGFAHRALQKTDEALASFERAAQLKQDCFDAHYQLGLIRESQQSIDDAVDHFRRAVALRPAHAGAHFRLAMVLRGQGNVEEATEQFELCREDGCDLGLRYQLATILPTIYRSEDEVRVWRRRFLENVARLRQEGVKLSLDKHVVNTYFLLAYQGLNDRDALRAISDLWEESPSFVPSVPQDSDRRTGRIRVGFLSSFLKNHTIGKLTAGIIAQLSREAFHISILTPDDGDDLVCRWFREQADDYVVVSRDLAKAIAAVAHQNLDVLVYPDIGMDPTISSLARTRLAPIQCVMWGHPVTTGMPSIDYFLSSELLEVDEADDHYTEQLVRFSTLPSYFYRPTPPTSVQGRAAFGLPEKCHLYLCPQNLFKIHPEFDVLLESILRRDRHGLLVLIEGHSRRWTELLRERFARTMPDHLTRIRFLPRQEHQDFLRLLAVADVILDPLHFGGGSTNYEALAMGTPIVTLPSEFLRGRAAAGMYQKMGVEDCVARTPQEYVEIAVRLGTDAALREDLAKRLREAASVLFEDAQAVRELEQFLTEAVRQGGRAPVADDAEPGDKKAEEPSLACEPSLRRAPAKLSAGEILRDFTCPACAHHVAVPFFAGGRQPLATLGWPRTAEAAISLADLPLSFLRCVNCGHVYNAQFDYGQVPYSDHPNLMYNQGELWRDHLEMVQQLILDHVPQRPTIVEIGCGEGHLLRALAEARPQGRYIGFDPNSTVDTGQGAIEARAMLFEPGLHLAELQPDLIISRHVFEHLANPLGFMQALAFAASWEGLETGLFIEVPCIDRALALGRTEDFYYEHNSHFTTQSFRHLLQRCASDVHTVSTGYNTEVVFGLAHFRRCESQVALAQAAIEFRQRAAQSRLRLRKQITALSDSSRTVAIWGGTGKAAAFINQYGLDRERFPLVVDSDPAKAGMFVPGTGQEIRHRDFLRDQAVDVILIATQWRAADIVLEIEQCGISCETILIEHLGRLLNFFGDEHPYRNSSASRADPAQQHPHDRGGPKFLAQLLVRGAGEGDVLPASS